MASFAWSAPDQAVLCGPNEGSEPGDLHHTSPTLDPVLILLSASPELFGLLTDRWAVTGSNRRPPACKFEPPAAGCARVRSKSSCPGISACDQNEQRTDARPGAIKSWMVAG